MSDYPVKMRGGISTGARPDHIAVTDGLVVFLAPGVDGIGLIRPDGSKLGVCAEEYSIGCPVRSLAASSPRGKQLALTFDTSTDDGAGRIAVIDLVSSKTKTVGWEGGANPRSIAAASDGSAWVTFGDPAESPKLTRLLRPPTACAQWEAVTYKPTACLRPSRDVSLVVDGEDHPWLLTDRPDGGSTVRHIVPGARPHECGGIQDFWFEWGATAMCTTGDGVLIAGTDGLLGGVTRRGSQREVCVEARVARATAVALDQKGNIWIGDSGRPKDDELGFAPAALWRITKGRKVTQFADGIVASAGVGGIAPWRRGIVLTQPGADRVAALSQDGEVRILAEPAKSQ
jgi:hypothetical protein